MAAKLDIIRYDSIDYKKAYQLQLELRDKRLKNAINDTLLLVEHPPVLTIGTSGSRDNLVVSSDYLSQKGIEVIESNRGGDITYHGPGQIVGYPILNLKEHKQDLHWLLRSYEEVFIRFLKDYNIEAQRISGLTGVWVGNEKITAIGVGVRRWITYHGFAFNINPNLEHFSYIIPCGIKDKGVTSLKKLLGYEIEKEEVAEKIIKYFAEVFEIEVLNHEK
ncbi:MAG: lipoyl(octanoyl) transferase [Halanaerobium sp. 4-GBenrich]|jgi:lipoate-protein ligase B|uniref:Octanoyltransferase n=1 Tax=Halanaerobium congolense TaxID=54121 RepID=A0A1G6SUT5_9FIRM|nr:lipoyl(octanoyl) transferase LipB [Halanaerobium congolense]KXS49886.1 MAG: lipoyl(octanoyl) transferase [Halanaerobium sp. T82-1]ODS50114.1 MAG: lipoyl(octanoyl) transferase [Halanaerobium sp. 4-GBenrich]PUU92194.1 MAG: lipoyl(octanoyl) transferase [Halanaerobium sp.]PTX15594.1 lipoyl(octanoyl) transferase [Halanaerobium congolense]PXV62411.1 lipoyl(octanoyl) transferase [Halanaerobium congolense]